MIDLATGVDLVEISRIKEIKPGIRERFLKRIYTDQEIISSAGKENSLAGYWAAKEAGVKALGCGIGEISWQELEVQVAPSGAPRLALTGKALELAEKSGWSTWSLSISHTRKYAIACVTALIISHEDEFIK